MSAKYPQRLLTAGERVVACRHPHWKMLAAGLWWIPPTLAVCIAGMVAIDDPRGMVAAAAVAVVLLLAVVWQVADWRLTTYTVTSQRVAARRGVLSRRGVEVPLDRITNVVVEKTVLQRLLCAGDIAVKSASDHAPTRLADITDPDGFQRLVYHIQAQHGAAASNTDTGGSAQFDSQPVGDTTGAEDRLVQLERLTALHADGHLSDGEFTAAKRQILGGGSAFEVT